MTTLTSPIAKLYKRCARGKHDTCPGSFETWSVCSCACHAGVSDERAAPAVTCADKVEAVAEAIAIVTPVRKAAPKAKASGLSTKTDKYAKWANAIVARNARLETAWRESQERNGLYLPAGAGFRSTLAPLSDNGTHHCPHKAGDIHCGRCEKGE